MRYNPNVPGCLEDINGVPLCVVTGQYWTWCGGLTHRIIWEMFNGKIPDGMMIDHIDRDKLNPRIENLRLANRAQNGANSVRNRANGLPSGVSVRAAGGFYVSITHDGKTHRYKAETLEDACGWRNQIGRELKGEYYLDIVV